MNVLEVLEACREEFQDPESWTTHAFARDNDGDIVSVFDADVVSMCIMGRVCLHSNGPEYGPDWDEQLCSSKEVLDVLAAAIPQPIDTYITVSGYNDEHCDHDELLRWIDRAIELAKKGESHDQARKDTGQDPEAVGESQ